MEITIPLVKQFFKDFTIDYKPGQTIYSDELEMVLKREYPNIKIYLMNPVYSLFSDEQYDKFFKRDQTDKKIWTNKYNCWCFAAQVRLNARAKLGNPALGEFHTQGHAVNIYVTDKLAVRVREPQTDKFYIPLTEQHISM